MAVIQRSSQVPFTATQMFQLVDAIEDYPDFLPWCKESKIISRNDDEVLATLTLAGGGFQKSFSTCNRMQRNKMIEIRLLEGPFKHLEGFWRFQPEKSKGCTITLDLEFEFAGRLISMAFAPIFNQVANSLVDAFTKRANVLYGSTSN
jgi:ribosome-associated toxin RatA of RatAB toxin-antitoxin module